MSVRFSESTILFSDIILEDQSFRITTDADKPMDQLAASIAEVGLLSPPILWPMESGGFQVVSGFRRLAVFKRMGLASLPCRVVENDADRLACQKLAIADNVSRRTLNMVEQARAVDKLSPLAGNTERLCEILSGLGLPVNPSLIKKLKVLLQLPQTILAHVARETIPLSVALLLAPLNEPDALALAALFVALRLGTNKQREIACLAQEIALREGITISGLFEKDAEIQGILGDPDADRGQMAAQLRVYLEKKRFPALMQSHEQYRQLEKQLKLGRRVRLFPPQHFEGTDFILELAFSDMDEFHRHAALVNRLVADNTLEKILSRSGRMDGLSRKKTV